MSTSDDLNEIDKILAEENPVIIPPPAPKTKLSRVRTFKRTVIMEAQQFAHDERPYPPGTTEMEGYGPDRVRLPNAVFVTDGNGESWRMKDGDWVVWDPLHPVNVWYFEDGAFQGQFSEVK